MQMFRVGLRGILKRDHKRLEGENRQEGINKVRNRKGRAEEGI